MVAMYVYGIIAQNDINDDHSIHIDDDHSIYVDVRNDNNELTGRVSK